jgi:hypothetical protein
LIDLLILLRAISKKSWLKLKEDYLAKQKQEVNELKAKLSCLNRELERKEKEISQAKNKSIKSDDMIEGCLLKLNVDGFGEDSAQIFELTRQQFKDKYLKETHEKIAYVDLAKSSNCVYIRCKSKEIASSLLNEESFLPTFKKVLLEGKEEEEYFERISSNRTKKLEKKKRKEEKEIRVIICLLIVFLTMYLLRQIN